MFQFQYFHIPRILSRDYCTRALQALETIIRKPQHGVIHLIVIPSEEMARMNLQFRGKEGPTDILTFSYLNQVKSEFILRSSSEGKSVTTENGKGKVKRGGFFKLSGMDSTSRSPALLAMPFKASLLAGMTGTVAGEIYLCLEKIKSYAKDAGKTYKEQLEYIIIHGLVHLMGYDHETDADWREMEKVEKRIQSLLT